MEAVMIGGMLLSGGLKAASSIIQANAESQAMEYNAQQADRNALLTEEQYRKGESDSRIDSRYTLGSIRAQYGASGVTMDGSPREFLELNRLRAEENALSIRNQGILQAKGYREQAKNLRAGIGGVQAGGFLGAAGAALDSGANVLSKTLPSGNITSPYSMKRTG